MDNQENILLKIRYLRRQLKETDYLAIKFGEGVLSENEFYPIKVQREEWRKEINKLENELRQG